MAQVHHGRSHWAVPPGEFPEPQGSPRWHRILARLLSGAIAALTPAIALLSVRSATAAETLKFSFQSVSLEISLGELEAFASRGELPRGLRFYQGSGRREQLNAIQRILGQPLQISPTTVSQFLSLPEGDELLNRLGYLVKPTGPQGEGAAPRLRQAILAAAVDPAGLSLLNLVRQFPEDVLELDLSLAIALVEENAAFYGRRSEIIQAFWPEVGSTPDSAQALPALPLLTPRGPYRWRVQGLNFRNPERPSFSQASLYLPQIPNARPNNNQPGSLPSQIPVVILSHGLGANRLAFAYLAEQFASHGYGVIALEHSETNSDRFNRFLNGLAAPPSPAELTSRPRDISAVLDDLSQRAERNPSLAQLNLTSVGVLGQSLGGYTVLAAAGATINRPLLEQRCAQSPPERRLSLNISMPIQCRILELPAEASLAVADPRVAAAIALNPVTSQIFGPEGMAQIKKPVMIVAGTDDFVAPTLPEQVEPFGWIGSRDKYLVMIENATHFTLLGHEGNGSVLPLPDRLFGPEGDSAQAAIAQVSLAFFNRHLRQQRSHEAYLTQAYLTRLEGSPFRYAIVRELPDNLSSQPLRPSLP